MFGPFRNLRIFMPTCKIFSYGWFPNIMFLWVPSKRGYSILGSIPGSPDIGKVAYALCSHGAESRLQLDHTSCDLV